MSISTRYVFPLLLSALIGGLPVVASAQPPQVNQQMLPGPGGSPPPGARGGHQGWNGPHGGQGGYHGQRHYHGGGYRGDGYRGGDDGAGAAVAAGIIGLAVGAMAADAARQNAYRGDSHVRWCLRHYRSYDPDTDTYRGRDGRRHYCR